MDSLSAQPSYPHDTPTSSPESVPKFQNDAVSDYESSGEESVHKSRKPLTTFDTSDSTVQDVENGFVKKERRRSRRKSWWNSMATRARRRSSTDSNMSEREDADGPLLGDLATRQKARRKRTWYNYCIFGGISGLTILALLLLVNLALTIATLFWSSDIDRVLYNWGRPGTGTEGLAWYPTDFTRDVVPIKCHSHNDYWRQVPLFSALRAGCTGVEADVWLFDNDLYVGHDTASLQRNRTFQSLYINPLVEILKNQNPETDFYNGTTNGVFDAHPARTLTLLVDVKTSGAETWPWVLEQLQPLRERGWLSFVDNNKVVRRPIIVVGTGNTPFDVLTANSTYRDAFFDAPLDEMWDDEDEGSADENMPKKPLRDAGQGKSGTSPGDEFNKQNSYYASVSFVEAVGRMWRGKLSPKQMKIIRGQIRGAHKRGLKARYWDTPAWPLGLRNQVWDVLVREGVDMLNVDDLRGASKQVW